MNRGTHLLELQGIENDLRDKIAAYKKIQKQLNVTSPVRVARQAYEEAAEAERAARARQQDVNLEWQGVRQKVDTEEKLLYSGTIRNPKELEALQLEVEFLKKRREKLEEQALEIIEEVERLAQQSEQALEAYNRIEQESRENEASLADKGNALRRDIAQRRRLREDLLTSVDPADLDQYRYVQRLKNDTHAVAMLNEGVCGACHIEVSNSKRDSVERSGESKLVTCGNCGRILVS